MSRNSFFDIITVISTSKKHKTFYIIVLYTLLILIDDFAETLNLIKSCSLDPYPTIPPLYSYDIPLISLSTFTPQLHLLHYQSQPGQLTTYDVVVVAVQAYALPLPVDTVDEIVVDTAHPLSVQALAHVHVVVVRLPRCVDSARRAMPVHCMSRVVGRRPPP
jgi:hypothetical protein